MSLALLAALAASAAGTPSLVVSNGGMAIEVLEPAPPAEPTEEPRPESASVYVKKGTAFRAVSLKGKGPKLIAKADGTTDENGCGGSIRGVVQFPEVTDIGVNYVLVPGDWPALPDAMTQDDGTKPDYAEIIAAALASNGAKDAKPTEAVALKADLDGDGKDEIVVSAHNIKPDAHEPQLGDFSLLAVKRGSDGKIVPLSVDTIGEDRVGMGDVAIAPVELVALADVDGNGQFEVVATVWGYEQVSTDAWSIAPDGTATTIAQAYCGV